METERWRQLRSLFSVPVGVVHFGEFDIDEIRTFAASYEYEGNDRSDQEKNWQSKSLAVLNDIPELKEFFTEEVNRFKDKVLACDSTPFAFTTSWFTKTAPGGSCEWHDHRNSWISGCFYLDGGEDWGPFAIEAPIGSKHSMLVMPDNWTEYNQQATTITPEPGLLILFPSNLRHRILWHHGNDMRYSLAFNTYPVGVFGSRDSVVSITVDDVDHELA